MAVNFVVRVWLPDRPGALGAVASRIGAVRGDLVGIDILETGAGRAIDELVVSLPDEDLVPLLVKEMQEVEGVDVEDVRPVEGELPDARVAALESAAELLAQGDSISVCSKRRRPRRRATSKPSGPPWCATGHLVATNGADADDGLDRRVRGRFRSKPVPRRSAPTTSPGRRWTTTAPRS